MGAIISSRSREQLRSQQLQVAASGIRSLLPIPPHFPVMFATSRSDQREVDKLLEQGHSVNETGHLGTQPLLIAAEMGDVDMILFLLEKRADINATNSVSFSRHYCPTNCVDRRATPQQCLPLILVELHRSTNSSKRKPKSTYGMRF